MSDGYWRIVLTSLAIAGLLSLGYAGYQQLDKTELQSYPNYEYQPARDRVPPLPSEETPITPKAYHPDCDAPKDGNDADLCAQWAAVQTVEESNRLSRIAIKVTALEFGALVISLIFTGWAAYAAQSAATAANASIKHEQEGAAAEAERFAEQLAQMKRSADASFSAININRQIGEAQVRAYVGVSDAKIRIVSSELFGGIRADGLSRTPFDIKITVRNTGLSPTKLCVIDTFAEYIVNEVIDGKRVESRPTSFSSNVTTTSLGSGRDIVLEHPVTVRNHHLDCFGISDTFNILIDVKIKYSDVFDVQQSIEFIVSFNKLAADVDHRNGGQVLFDQWLDMRVDAQIDLPEYRDITQQHPGD